jgi:hypothetical protein
MLETLTVITICVTLLIIFRNGKTEPLKNPLVINRVGQFQAVLAPMLNLAQPMLENISKQLGEQERHNGNSNPLYFKVRDKEIKAHGKDFYLLAATLRDGVLYFQAAAPEEQVSDLDTIRAFSETEMSRHPAEMASHSDAAEAALTNAIQTAAGQRGSALTPLA